jgi:hypothetical protein
MIFAALDHGFARDDSGLSEIPASGKGGQKWGTLERSVWQEMKGTYGEWNLSGCAAAGSECDVDSTWS